MNPREIKARRQLLDRIEEDFEAWFQRQILQLQASCTHTSIEFSNWCGSDVGLDCSDCGKVLLDPYSQDF